MTEDQLSVVPAELHPTADIETSWDGDAANDRIKEWAGGPDKEEIDWSKYQEGFTWYDLEDKENFGSYKLPHHDIIDGAIKTVWNGVKAAMGALLGARGGVDIPDDEKEGVYNHLAKHYEQFEKDVPEFKLSEEESEDEPEDEPVDALYTNAMEQREKNKQGLSDSEKTDRTLN